MQWKKLTRLKAATGNSRTRRMLCCGRRKENGRSVPDVTASPGRAPPGPLPNSQMQNMAQRQGGIKEPVLIQGDFRKVSGISSEIFRQIEAVENDHDPNTAAALEAVERRGEMIVRVLEARNIGGKHAVDAAQRLLSKGDARHTVQLVEIVKRPGQTLGLYIREGNGADRADGVFISRIALESAVYNSGCLRVGDEILAVNLVDVTHMSLDDVVIIMSIPRRLVLAIRQRRGSRGANSPGPTHLSRPEQKPPPVVVIKRDLRDEDLNETDRIPRSRSSRERRTGDGREMTESRSRLGLGLNNYSPQSEQLDLYYNSRPNIINEPPSWGYKPPPPPSVITEQPKGHHSFAPSHAYYQNAGTLESLAEKVHSFYPGGPSRRMSAGTGPSSVGISQSHARFPRSGSDQHLPRVEYSDYSSSLGRHSLLRSSLKTGAPIASGGGTLGRYGRYEPPRTSKYGTPPGPGSLTRRSRPNLDYSSDTEATIGPSRPSYYYYNRPALGSIPRAGPTSVLGITPDLGKFNSLPRDRPGVRLGGLRTRLGERLLDDADGNLSAPESSVRRERDLLRARITASPSIFTSDEYRAWLRRAPSSSAICDQMRLTRDLLTQPRSHRFSCSAENIHDALRNTESIYSSRTGVMTGGTLDRNLSGIGPRGIASLPVRSMSSQHISGPQSIRSPSIRRMRQLLELSTGPGSPSGSIISGGHQSPAPTPSATLPRSHRQIDINPAEFAKYKLDKPVMDVGGVSGMLWIHLLAGRGLRTQPDMTSTNQALALQQQQQSRDLYCVLECDRVHKARTVVRSGDLQFDWDESFELDLVCNKQLDVLVYSWDPQHRHKLCYRGAISLASLLRQSPLHQLALKVEPRGTIYIRLRHTDPITLYKRRGLPSLRAGYPQLFGADLESVVNRESKGAPGSAPVPVVLRRCVEEVERRGLDIIGLYRLCGSATKKRLLREAFERNSRAVELSPEHVPDINVITGVLKDYLRELPEPLFTRCLFQMTVDALAVCLPDDPEGNAKLMLSILDCLPRANRATLVFLLDHLSLVVSASERNKMSAQALATVMGPPLMLHSASAAPSADIDHAQPIAVLKYLLQIWPQPQLTGSVSGRRGEPTGQRGNKVNVLQADKHQLLGNHHITGSMSVGNMVLSHGQHHLLATAITHPYQSVVGQLAQSPRVLQQVAQQVKHPQSVVSADSVMHAQSPLPGTPSPGSSSTSTGSGSGSGTDTVKRGASPVSVKHVKILDSSNSHTINTTKHQQQQNIDSTNNITLKFKDNLNDKSRNNGNICYGPNSSSSSIISSNGAAIIKSSSVINTKLTTKSVQPLSSTSTTPSSSSIKSYTHADDSDSDTASSTRSKTPNPLLEQSQALTTTQLMSKYLKREPLVSMTLISSPSPAIMSSLSSSIRDITTASQTASSRYDNNNYNLSQPSINLSNQQQQLQQQQSLSSSSVTSEPTSLYSNNISRNQVSSSQQLGTYHFPSNSIITTALNDDNNKKKLSSSSTLIQSSGSSAIATISNNKSSSSASAVTSGSSSSSATELIGTGSLGLSKSSYNNKVSSPSRQISTNNTTINNNNNTLPTSVARNILLYQSASADSNNYSLSNKQQLQQQQQQSLAITDDKQSNNINNYPVSPDPFNTSYINFGSNVSSNVGSSASLSQSSQSYGGGSNSSSHYNIYGTLPKSTNQSIMLSSTSSYLSGSGVGGGSTENTTTSSGISSMAGSTSSYDFYTNTRQYQNINSGTTSSNIGGNGSSGNGSGNYHTLGSYRVQYSSTNPFLETFDPPQQQQQQQQQHGNDSNNKSSLSQLKSFKDKYDDDEDDLK